MVRRYVVEGDDEPLPDAPATRAALGRVCLEVDELRGRLDEVERSVRQREEEAVSLRSTLAQLAVGRPTAPATATGADAPVEPPPEWWTVEDPDRAQEILLELDQWVVAVFRGYGGSGLARCWPWHPAAVADLLACWQAWRAAYVDPEARLTLGADWHDRYQPTTQRRLKAILGGCLDEVGGHEVDGQQCRIQLDQLATYARWWAGNRGRRLEPGELPPGVRIAGAAS